jgi:hypothetical protein
MRDLRYFLEEDAWGKEWVSKFFEAEFADEPVSEPEAEPVLDDHPFEPWDQEAEEQRAGN